MILMIDNYDSFTWNLVHYLMELGAEVKVVRNDALTAAEALASNAQGFLISPGPKTPTEAGISLDLVAACAVAGRPLLGVCLGHQAIGQHFGGRVVRGGLMHGKTSPVTHTEVIPPAQARFAPWPEWLNPAIVAAFAELGLHRPWQHQVDAAEHAFAGRHVVVATGTASGKSLAYQLPVLQTLLGDHNATALYLTPTKALGVDQLRSFTAILATPSALANSAGAI